MLKEEYAQQIPRQIYLETLNMIFKSYTISKNSKYFRYTNCIFSFVQSSSCQRDKEINIFFKILITIQPFWNEQSFSYLIFIIVKNQQKYRKGKPTVRQITKFFLLLWIVYISHLLILLMGRFGLEYVKIYVKYCNYFYSSIRLF